MNKFFTLVYALLSFHISIAQNINTNVVSELKLETTDNVSTITAKAFNKTDIYLSLKYVLSVITFDKDYKSSKVSLEEFLKSNNVSSKTLQDFINSNNSAQYSSKESLEDLFSLDPYQSKYLRQISLDSSIENKIIVLLLIFNDENKLVSTNRVVFNDKQSKSDSVLQEKRPRDGLEISGIVVDETKTKIGKDFYDRFYFYYSFNNVRGDQVVKIDEMFTFRRTTKVMVKIEDEIIFEFFARPNEEYIEEMAKLTVQRVYKYFEIRKKEKSYISQY
jgi:hypothetical protein